MGNIRVATAVTRTHTPLRAVIYPDSQVQKTTQPQVDVHYSYTHKIPKHSVDSICKLTQIVEMGKLWKC